MGKDVKKTKILPVPMTTKARKNLMDIQADRQKQSGKRTPLKVIATELLENANHDSL